MLLADWTESVAPRKKLKTFGQLLRDTRAAQGISVRDLAKLSGFSSTYISRVENGIEKTFSERFVSRIVVCLNMNYLEAYFYARVLPESIVKAIFSDRKVFDSVLREANKNPFRRP